MASSPDALSGQMWQLFVNELTGNLSGNPPANIFMPTSGFMLADWEALDTAGLPLDQGQKKGDTIVANLVAIADDKPVWSPVYQPGDSFYQAYNAFLGAIQLTGGNPAMGQLADSYRATRAQAASELQADQAAAFTDYITYKSEATAAGVTPQAYKDWYAASTYPATIVNDKNAWDQANENYLQAQQAFAGPDAITLSKAITAATLVPANSITDGAGNLHPAYAITGDLDTWFVDALAQILGGRGTPITFEVDLSTAQAGEAQQSSFANSSSSGGGGFWFFGGGGSSSSSSSQSSSDFSSLVQTMKMTYTAQAIGVFTVTPGPWYDDAMIVGFHDKISPASAFANKPMFGDGGLLNLRASQVYVALRRSITLTGTADTIAQMNAAFAQSSQSSWSIGGLFWSGSASEAQGSQSSSASVSTSADGMSITIVDTSDVPKVIGIVPLNNQPATSFRAARAVPAAAPVREEAVPAVPVLA
jgi:hypothetical protein